MRDTRYLRAAVMVVAASVATVWVLAQVLPDADFNNLTAQGSVPLTLGDNTARNICINFDDPTYNDSLCFSTAASNRLLADTAGFGILGGTPQMQFYDTDFSSTTAAGGFSVVYGSPEADDSSFQIAATVGGLAETIIELTTTANENTAITLNEDASPLSVGYLGSTGAQYAFLIGAQGYYFDDDIYVDEASPGGVFLKNTGGSCFKCSLTANQAYTITNGTTDRAFDANATSCQVTFTATTILAADQYLVQLRSDVAWVRVSCNWNGGTTPSVTVDLEECDSAGASCGAAQTASLTCDGGGDSTTAFGGTAGGTANTDDWINLNFGTPSGVAGVLTVTVTANLPDCELADALGSVIADLDTLNHLGTAADEAVVCAAATCPTVTP